MSASISQIIFGLIKYKYLILFPIVVLEGPIITVIAGFLSSLNYLNLFIAYAVVVCADIAGDCIYYALGYWGREKFIKKCGHYIGISNARVIRLENHFDNHSGKTLFLGKISHGIGGVFLFAAGLAKMPFSKFIWFNFIATVIKSMALILIGFYFGEAITKINSFFELVGTIFLGIGIAAILIYFYYYRKKGDGKIL